MVRAMAALADRFPLMGDPVAAHPHFELAVTALRRRYREVPLTPIARPTSDAQLDAEAA